MNVGRAAKVGLAAGLVAGLVLGLFNLLVIGPLIAEAESYEVGAEEPAVPPALTRAMTIVGALILGVFVGIAFALVFPFLSGLLPGRNVLGKALVLAPLAFVVFPLLPNLVVPAAPPGVEQVAVEFRQLWFVGGLLAALGGLVSGYALYRLLAPQATSRGGRMALLFGSVVLVGFVWALPFLLQLALRPDFSLDPGNTPVALIEAFRLYSLLGWALFWAVLTAATGLLWPRLAAGFASRPAGAGV